VSGTRIYLVPDSSDGSPTDLAVFVLRHDGQFSIPHAISGNIVSNDGDRNAATQKIKCDTYNTSKHIIVISPAKVNPYALHIRQFNASVINTAAPK